MQDAFYQKHDFRGVTVFDPFMGSGTTVGEAHKLGCRAAGRDINPVAYESVRVSLGKLDRYELTKCFQRLNATVGEEILSLYKCLDDSGTECDVLYYFWVKILPCPACSREVELFSTYIFAQHAYVKREPRVQVYCPQCGTVFPALHHDKRVCCPSCEYSFDPHAGPAKGSTVTCSCGEKFSMAKTSLKQGSPPSQRLYSKLCLNPDGEKQYVRATERDVADYRRAAERLERENLPLPDLFIEPGHNTQQSLNYGYRNWNQFFNARQLLALGLLGKAISAIKDDYTRGAMALLFSSTLEFNNMFASYKGEGTGAVRHMFSHHILKPERVPIEANCWGTPKSSGAFSTLFKSRLLRALDYRDNPFEIALSQGKTIKEYGCSLPFTGEVSTSSIISTETDRTIVLSCGDSSAVSLPDKSVDYVITDPPFFDNVHYSELADFFYAWQVKVNPQSLHTVRTSTRSAAEVQDKTPSAFSLKLTGVWKECCRILKDTGLLVFSYHHSRAEGWESVATATANGGFSIVQAHPIKSELSVASPKSQAKEPIDLDVILVCRKTSEDCRTYIESSLCATLAESAAKDRLARFARFKRKLSMNDVMIIVKSQLLVNLFAGRDAVEISSCLIESEPIIKATTFDLHTEYEYKR